MRLKKALQRGQTMLLCALLIPVMLLFAGLGLDLGWYYLNVSRLQNAVDAAALAGAQALVKKDNVFDNYYLVQLASNQLPADFDTYSNVFTNTFGSNGNGIRLNYFSEDDAKDTLLESQVLAEKYTRINLGDEEAVSDSTDWKTLSATDAWNNSIKEEDRKVSGTIDLKYQIVDGKNDKYGPLYYVVSLNEKIRHFLLPGWFEPMNAPVKAVVLLQPHHLGLITPMEYLEKNKVIDNWEYTKKYKGTEGFYAGKWNHYQAAPGLSGNSNKGIKYTSGNTYRTESVTVRTQDKNKDSTSSGTTTAANGGNFYSESEVDSINIDFRAEVTGKFKSDWDLGYDFPETGHKYQFAEGWSATDGADKRIHFNADFDQSFRTRDPSKEADPLWVRIESDPLKNPYTGAGVSNFNSVRQITLNFNDDNTKVATNSDGSKYYEKRPYVIFYTGPENIDYTVDPVTGVLIRHSQPVVLNLNEDTNAIIYMPESPVIINGNGHALHGFVIAKCYLSAVTQEDMTNGKTNGKTFQLYDGFNEYNEFKKVDKSKAETMNPKPATGDFDIGIDGMGQTVFFHSGDLLTKEQVQEEYPNATIITDEKGNVTVMDKIDAPKRLLLNYTKADSNTYEVKYENGTHDENKTFAAYVNATYKEKYKTVSGLNDSQITAVSFPAENYNETTAIYYVANEYVSASKVNDNYVKVLVNGSTMYADKTKLPYVKVRFNANCFYVCVADLQLLKDANGNKNGNKGVRMVDTTDGDKDIYVNPTSIDQYGDSWKIDKAYYDTNGNWKNWTKDKVEFSADGSYFMLKSEINNEPQTIAKYHKLTYEENGEVKTVYAKDGDNLYYTKVQNNAKNADNYIIVDENGNMLTKPITAPDVLTVTTVAENNAAQNKADEVSTNYFGTNGYTRATKEPEELPGDAGTTNENGQYRGKSEYRKYEDYRIPVLERVYKANECFNLKENDSDPNEDSYYSYFYIDLLKRVNYTYLNVDELNGTTAYKYGTPYVDDMFFTTVRAGWID